MSRRILLLACLLLTVLPAGLARAHGQAIIQTAAGELRADPVWVDPTAIPAISTEEAAGLRNDIDDAGRGIYVAVLPADALHEAETAEEVLRRVARASGRPGTYAVVVGGQFRAASSAGPERARVPALATEAFEEHGAEGIAPTLAAFVGSVAEARGRDGDNGGGVDGGIVIGGLAVLAAAGAGGLVLVRRRTRARELAEVRAEAEADIVALGDEIRALDLDVELPGADEDAKADYARALDSYEQASAGLRHATRAEDLAPVGAALEAGRFAMVSAAARLNGKEPPERRPPCFFDPRHGPSTRDVEWAPPGGSPRPVPACEADALRVEAGEEPLSREVLADGRRVPYWNASPAYGPWAGGFFGGATGSLLPALFVGSALGAGMGLGFPEDAGAAGDGFDQADGEIGGGDFGGGDFGGGDFGGGDF